MSALERVIAEQQAEIYRNVYQIEQGIWLPRVLVERWVAVVTNVATELEELNEETAQVQAAALRELLRDAKS